MRKLFISLCFSACCSLLAAQTTNPIQEAMANYDYETALMLIDQETPTVPLLYQNVHRAGGRQRKRESAERAGQ